MNDSTKNNIKYSSTYTLTFGDQAENHVGMQKIGTLADKGFTIQQLEQTQALLQSDEYPHCDSELVHLNDSINIDAQDAAVLIIRNGVDVLLGEGTANRVFIEQASLEYDQKAFMYGRVVNKSARFNLCFAGFSQEPDYENKKGRVVSFDDVPVLNALREGFSKILAEGATDLAAEGNYYHDPTRCGIGFHGDTERKKVIAVRVGVSLPLQYQWFYRGNPVGDRVEHVINHGDIYIMSEKASGHDWKKRNIATLRHAAGAQKFLVYKKKSKPKKANNKNLSKKRKRKGINSKLRKRRKRS
eukprot:TRINITY_DN11177_c0_g1_i1.p1 TRINITY_DN11177_c0_g1~~TRINITY_DN11177_c0_g1_i1.p1  ORF type:complete len:300 (-),score=56.64 TRINITY_DN11177_c0_g1_i1:58-957(-)